MASLTSVFLEELTDFPAGKFCYEVNGLQFEALRDLVLDMLRTVGKETNEDWSYFFQGNKTFLLNFI